MSKDKEPRQVMISHCVCCHAIKATLYKLDKNGAMICKSCRSSLIKTGEVSVVSGGKLMFAEDGSNVVEYQPDPITKDFLVDAETGEFTEIQKEGEPLVNADQREDTTLQQAQ